MLTLGRKSGESVSINGNITVTAHTETGSNKIKLEENQGQTTASS
jgi:sRNA-binding carbon storage regulator CsrA